MVLEDIANCQKNIRQVLQGEYNIAPINVLFNLQGKQKPIPVYVDGKPTLHRLHGFCDGTSCEYRRFLQYPLGGRLVLCENPAVIDPLSKSA